MLKLLFLTIILYIIIQHLLDDCEDTEIKPILPPIQEEKTIPVKKIENQIKPANLEFSNAYNQQPTLASRADLVENKGGMVTFNQVPKILSTSNKQQLPKILSTPNKQQLLKIVELEATNTLQNKILQNETFANEPVPYIKPQPEPKIWEFDRPNPWTKVIFNETDEYPYYFHIKISIPSLNDYEMWKQIVPNIDFNPRTGELIIPSKEEASALALANLICINFSGQMSIENILDKNLIQISIGKSRAHEVVQNKLREQIMENLYGKSVTKVQTSFEKDLAMNGIENDQAKVDFKSDNFTDTFEHFTENNNTDHNIEAYDGGDYSYF